MIKKIFLLVTLVLIIVILTGSSFAIADNLVYSKDARDTGEFLFTVTRPERNESTFKKLYVICGNSDKENIRVKLLSLNRYTDTYEPLTNDWGESTWDIGGSGVFMKEIKLPKVGTNNLRIVAYNKKQEDNLVPGQSLQISNFNVTLLDRGIRDVIKNSFFRFADMLRSII